MTASRLFGISFLIGVVAVQILGQKILSSKKRCGDPQCEGQMMRASAKQDYSGPDCRFLSFKAGEEINVYYKLAEGREDLWQGSIGKAYGFFPRDAVTIEEVYLSEEVEVPAQEIDFVCLDGGDYVFENEDSVLHKFRENGEDFMDHPEKENREKTSSEGGISTEDLQDGVNPNEEVTDKPPWAQSGIAGWFGMGSDKQDNTAKAEHVNEEGLLAEQIPENNVVQPKDHEVSQPENSGWFGGRLKKLLPFGGKNTQSDTETSETSNQFANEEFVVETEENTLSNPQKAEQENQEIKNPEEANPKWFNFAIKNVLSFGAKNEIKKEVPSQSEDEIGSNEITKQLSPTLLNATGSETEHKTENSEVVQLTTEESKHETKLNLNNGLEHSTVFGETDKSGSDESNIGNTDGILEVLDQQKFIKIPEQENNKNFQEDPEDPKSVMTNHESTNWFKSVVSNMMNLGKGDKDQVKRETNHGVDLSITNLDPSNDNRNSIPGEMEPSSKDFIEKNNDPDIHSDKPVANEFEGTLKEELNIDPVEDSSTKENKIHLEDDVILNVQEVDSPTSEGIRKLDPNPDSRHELLLKTDKELSIGANTGLSSLEKVGLAAGSASPEEAQEIKQDGSINVNVETLRAHFNSESTLDKVEENTKSSPVRATEKVTGQCGPEEQSANGYCKAQHKAGQPMRSAQPTEEHCEDIVHTTSAYPTLPSAAEITLFLKKMWLRCQESYNDIIVPVRSAYTSHVRKVVSLLPEDLQPGPDFHGSSWEVLIFTALIGCLSILAFFCRTVRCIKSRCYAGRELKLGDKFTEILNSKSEVLEKLSVVQKQYDEVQQSLQESGNHQLLEEIAEQKTLQENLQTSNRELEENISRIEQDLEEEKQRGTELDNTLSELNEKIKALEDSFKNEKSLKEEIRTTQKVFEITKGRLESSVRDAVEEQAHLQESIKQLSEEAEGWEERFSELSENSRMLSSSVQVMQEDLSNRQSQVKSLIDSLLKMKDWSSGVEEINKDEDEDGVLASIQWDFENGEPLGDPQKQTIKKLIFAAKLNASLKSVESEKKQLYENLSDEVKAKEHFSECISNLQNTNQSLSLEKRQLEEDVEKMKQKMSVMMEVYQENERKLHRKLTVQERERVQKEAKLSKADEKAIMADTELVTVRTRLTELEEETERSVTSYQTQVGSYEKKAYDNWLTARAAERYLSDVKIETLNLRQKLTEAEYKLELLEKDPFALDVIQAIGRAYADAFINHPENSPYGLSPINRVPENRAFLSPPPLLEGPLRLSPMLAGERGMRPPGYYPGYPGPKERPDVNADRKSDHQRTLSDAGSLSPPWDREQKNNVPPPGLPFPEHHFPPRRPDRFYHYPPPSGRFSGPAELTRNQGKPFMDSQDGRSSPEFKSRGNTSRDGPEEANNVPGAPTTEGEVGDGAATEYHMHLPPQMRVPLLPMDPRAPFFRRPFPMPPPPMDMYGPPGYPGFPPPHIAMRGPLPQQRFPYPMPADAFYPPQHIQPPPRGDHPSETQPVPPPSSDSSHNLPETQT
ncbi:melanoma inhibitory activity protein 2 isoform X3 [Rana temporaria]|uniref:melanoma inhibitory activity protein 2 isoform X3 n=1 Tax=Rana temporaria TaxID=8407 RepID=UPI001AAC5AC3|nr:melanoma inhibitory activity protein 2 isoform X3 [Rana temporaria]